MLSFLLLCLATGAWHSGQLIRGRALPRCEELEPVAAMSEVHARRRSWRRRPGGRRRMRMRRRRPQQGRGGGRRRRRRRRCRRRQRWRQRPPRRPRRGGAQNGRRRRIPITRGVDEMREGGKGGRQSPRGGRYPLEPRAKSPIRNYGAAGYACRWARGLPIRRTWCCCDKTRIVMISFRIGE